MFSFTDLTPQEVDILGAGLGKLPFEISAPVIQKLQSQWVDFSNQLNNPPENDNQADDSEL